jgi:hypothetical protein
LDKTGNIFIFDFMKKVFPIIFAVLTACTRTPSPEPFLTPTFEQVTMVEETPGAVTFTCRMSAMGQITECGVLYTDDGEQPEEIWTRAAGTRTEEDSFKVELKELVPGTTYAYRLFIGNGRVESTSARNYYTVPE